MSEETKVQLTEKEIQNAQIFLNRVDLKGNEAEAMVELKYKLGAIQHELRELQEPPADPDKGKK